MRPGVHFDPKDWEWFKPDADAEYSHNIEVDLSQVEPTVALPGDPQNAVPLSKLAKQPEIADLVSPDGRIYVSRVYTGSCMGGTLEAIKNMAKVFTGSNGDVKTVHPDVKFYFQAASENVYQEALKNGYIQTLESAGATLVKTACGACIGVGEGAMDEDNEVALFDTNRNFEGREGKGKKTKVFLGNEEISAATAITSYICSPEELT
jgi:homoaconitase/3-isopropylmalate dehydratase large subunit